MSILIYPSTKIYVACPANIASGGPELLHQIAYHIKNNLNIETFMFYYDFNKKHSLTPINPEYNIYNIPYTIEIYKKNDNKNNILIVPETFSSLNLLKKYSNIRKGVWFLSVDNYYYSKMTKKDFFFQRLINKTMRVFNMRTMFSIHSDYNLFRLSKKYNYRNDELLKLANFFMVNSYRGLKWFNDLKPLYYLSEYLNEDFLKTKTDLSKKENIVVYNPNKGFEFTKKIIDSANDIKFVPLVNMTREQVIKTLQRAKVYIDFGNHPGKDRIPREAAILGCCVITGKRGSAAFFEDVPIPDKYKFEDKKENIPKIIEKIDDCFENFEERYKDFDYYRKIIKNEPVKFVKDLKAIFNI